MFAGNDQTFLNIEFAPDDVFHSHPVRILEENLVLDTLTDCQDDLIDSRHAGQARDEIFENRSISDALDGLAVQAAATGPACKRGYDAKAPRHRREHAITQRTMHRHRLTQSP